MACLSTIRLIQALILVYSGAHPVSGSYRNCMCEEGNPLYCSQVRCPGSKCGDFTFSDNLNCTCKTVMTTAIGCQLLRINGCDLEFEIRPCSELHPFICSDSNYNFQIYQGEKKNWTEAVKTCESRDLQIARINFSVIHSSNNVSFWTGTFYGLASDNDTDVSHRQILTPEISTTSTCVKCEIKPEVFRMTTTSATPSPRRTRTIDASISTSSDVIHTTPSSQTVITYTRGVSHGNTKGIMWTTPSSDSHRSTKVLTSTVRPLEDRSGHHGNVVVIAVAVAISGVIVLLIVIILVVCVRKIRSKKKTNNKDIQLSDNVGLASHADQSLRGKSRDNGRFQNPIYLQEEHTAKFDGENGLSSVESEEKNMYDHFKHRHSDVESANDTYDHAPNMDIQTDSYGVLHQKYDDVSADVYDHVGGLNEGTYGHLYQTDERCRPDSGLYTDERCRPDSGLYTRVMKQGN